MVNYANTSINTNILSRSLSTDSTSYKIGLDNFVIGMSITNTEGGVDIFEDPGYAQMALTAYKVKRNAVAGNVTSFEAQSIHFQQCNQEFERII